MANFSRSFSNFSNGSLTIDISSEAFRVTGSGPVEISSTLNGTAYTSSESSLSSFSSSSSTSTTSITSISISSNSTSTSWFSRSASSRVSGDTSENSDMDGSVAYAVSVDDGQSSPDASVSFNNSGQSSALSIDISQVEAEIERINRYCSEVVSSISPETSGTATSTPRMARRVFRPSDTPVDVINLLNVDDTHRRSAANRVPEAVIDLCTPIRQNIPIATIDLDDYNIATPPIRRRSYASSSTPTTACTTSDVVASDVSPPKRKRNDQNQSSGEGYKCPVCLDCVRHREPTSTKCGHVFCRQCIEASIRSTHKCPMCNKKLSIRQVTRIYL
ncbi:E3 ubiquitin-protein ligase complex slx8-rfp subunit slx8 isoform X2 [Drosophila miranda]|uniref:E3 ubiquitin-protein ligase complex slx8-rfp subunit slx8 isoform X2 n=1 Tax=Drosophila miranda TaxID=7229 RepID=UPI0007E732DB|nr:E3 ubiquitin-protein ligase complex slx8-rfp subunit slx8 isoform X2 [Drosophila miranda]